MRLAWVRGTHPMGTRVTNFRAGTAEGTGGSWAVEEGSCPGADALGAGFVALVGSLMVTALALSPVAAGGAGAASSPSYAFRDPDRVRARGACRGRSSVSPDRLGPLECGCRPPAPRSGCPHLLRTQRCRRRGRASTGTTSANAQFVARFGPTPRDGRFGQAGPGRGGAAPRARRAPNDLSIPVRATAAQLGSAFSTGFRRYRVAGGRIAYANTDAPQLAGSVAPLIQSVVGLDDLNLAMPAGRHVGVPAIPGVGAAPELGNGRTAGVSDRSDRRRGAGLVHRRPGGHAPTGSPISTSRATWARARPSPSTSCRDSGPPTSPPTGRASSTHTAVTTVNVDGGPLASSGVGEADVDIEQVMSLAPDVRILVYQGPNNGAGGYDTYESIIASDQAKVISTSWGLCEPFTGSSDRPGREHARSRRRPSRDRPSWPPPATRDRRTASGATTPTTRWRWTIRPASPSSPVSAARRGPPADHRPPRRRGTRGRPAAGGPGAGASPSCGRCRRTRPTPAGTGVISADSSRHTCASAVDRQLLP